MAKVQNGIETLPRISIPCVGCTNVTDRQTDDRRTDRRPTTTYSGGECEFTVAKNQAFKIDQKTSFVDQFTAVACRYSCVFL